MGTRFALRVFPIIIFLTLQLVVTSRAEAKPVLTGRTAVIYLPGSNGFGITLTARANSVKVAAYNSNSETTYSVASGGIHENVVSSTIGKIGFVAAQFSVSRRILQAPPDGCKGNPAEIQIGRFLGTMRLRGERDFFDLRVKSAPGLIRDADWNCETRFRLEKERQDELRPGVSALMTSTSDGSRFFGAISKSSRSKGLSIFVMSTREHQGTVEVYRRAVAVAGSEAFRSIGPGITRVSPPWPFEGSALASGDRGSKSWAGSLRVLLPGRGVLRLADVTSHIRLVNKHSLARFFQVLSAF
jgi:hypothetical protein